MTTSPARYFHPSNLVTYLSLLAGLLAVFSAKALESLSVAGELIAFCALADTLDGKFARLFTRTDEQKQFGVELDSLADALAFGVVPVISFYLVASFESLGTHLAWLAAAFFYVLSAMTRLAFYNTHHDESSGFIGLPTTIAGLIWSSFLLAEPSAGLSVGLLFGCGLAMVSAIPVPRPGTFGTAAVLAWAVLLMVLHGFSVSIPMKPF